MLHPDISDSPSLSDTAGQPLTIAVFALASQNAAEARDSAPLMLVISVADRHGCPISGLVAQDFQVTTASGNLLTARNFAEDANVKGSYRLQVRPTIPLDSLRVDLARPQASLRGRGIVNFNSKTRAL